MQKTDVKEKAKDKHLIDQLTRHARKHGDGQKVAIWGCSGLFILCRAYFIVFLFLLAFPVIIGLGLWFFAGLFLSLAIKGRTYTDWNAEKIAQKELAKRKEIN